MIQHDSNTTNNDLLPANRTGKLDTNRLPGGAHVAVVVIADNRMLFAEQSITKAAHALIRGTCYGTGPTLFTAQQAAIAAARSFRELPLLPLELTALMQQAAAVSAVRKKE